MIVILLQTVKSTCATCGTTSFVLSAKYSTGHLLTQNADDGRYTTLTHYTYGCPTVHRLIKSVSVFKNVTLARNSVAP